VESGLCRLVRQQKTKENSRTDTLCQTDLNLENQNANFKHGAIKNLSTASLGITSNHNLQILHSQLYFLLYTSHYGTLCLLCGQKIHNHIIFSPHILPHKAIFDTSAITNPAVQMSQVKQVGLCLFF